MKLLMEQILTNKKMRTAASLDYIALDITEDLLNW